jgi:DNA-binding IclR family transcriptional regulator
LLAYGSKDLQQAVLDSLDRYTDKTITNADALKKQLKNIKDQGFAHSEEELVAGARTLAAPIFGPGNKVVAALGIVTPVDNRDIMRIAPLLQVSANALSKKLIAAGISKIVI